MAFLFLRVFVIFYVYKTRKTHECEHMYEVRFLPIKGSSDITGAMYRVVFGWKFLGSRREQRPKIHLHGQLINP